MAHFDYLVIGHITHDLTPDGYTIGGAVAYAGRTARLLGCRTAALTSAGPDCDVAAALPGITVHTVPAADTTTFDNRYEAGRRQQWLYRTANALVAQHLPAEWERTPIVHLAPVANEVSPAFIDRFSNSLVGITPQGWLRGRDEDGRVFARPWEAAQAAMPLVAAVILSQEDLPDTALLEQYRRWAPLLVLTQGAGGCTVYIGDEQRHFPAPTVPVSDLTGAGDIFAAAFLVRLYQTRGNPWEAAEFATQLASASVTQPDLASKVAHLKKVRKQLLEVG